MDGLPMEPCGKKLYNSLVIAVGTNLVIFHICRLNLLIIFTSMGFVAHSPPNFLAAQTSLGVSPGPIVTQLFASVPLFNQVSPFHKFNEILNQ